MARSLPVLGGTWNLCPLTLTNRISSEREDLSTGGLGMVFLASGSQPTAAARAKGSHVATPAAILDQTWGLPDWRAEAGREASSGGGSSPAALYC